MSNSEKQSCQQQTCGISSALPIATYIPKAFMLTCVLVFLLGPNGLFDPVWYAAIANGIRKCSVKNHVKVALSKLHNLILTIQYPCMGQLK